MGVDQAAFQADSALARWPRESGPLPGEKGVWNGMRGHHAGHQLRGIDNPGMNLPTNLKIADVPFQPWARAVYDPPGQTHRRRSARALQALGRSARCFTRLTAWSCRPAGAEAHLHRGRRRSAHLARRSTWTAVLIRRTSIRRYRAIPSATGKAIAGGRYGRFQRDDSGSPGKEFRTPKSCI